MHFISKRRRALDSGQPDLSNADRFAHMRGVPMQRHSPGLILIKTSPSILVMSPKAIISHLILLMVLTCQTIRHPILTNQFLSMQAGMRFSLSRKASQSTHEYFMHAKVKMLMQSSRFVRVILAVSLYENPRHSSFGE